MVANHPYGRATMREGAGPTSPVSIRNLEPIRSRSAAIFESTVYLRKIYSSSRHESASSPEDADGKQSSNSLPPLNRNTTYIDHNPPLNAAATPITGSVRPDRLTWPGIGALLFRERQFPYHSKVYPRSLRSSFVFVDSAGTRRHK